MNNVEFELSYNDRTKTLIQNLLRRISYDKSISPKDPPLPHKSVKKILREVLINPRFIAEEPRQLGEGLEAVGGTGELTSTANCSDFNFPLVGS